MKVNGKNIRERIISLVEKDQRYADDDKLLIAAIWYQEGWQDPRLYDMLKKVSSPESIRRIRQKLSEEGVIVPSSETLDARYNEYKQVRDDLGY